ncbi:MAG: hypothetical protein Q8940_14590, partial [Bacteroidota bacterium]|nr:hypothetical protein [Bacteroidota bacterium]
MYTWFFPTVLVFLIFFCPQTFSQQVNKHELSTIERYFPIPTRTQLNWQDAEMVMFLHYGDVAEVWFDGANGEGPNGKTQKYDWDLYYSTVRRLQPNALIAISGPDIRWIGNENGLANETEWCVQPKTSSFQAA